MLKKILILPAAVSTLFAAINLYFTILDSESTMMWNTMRGLASFFVIGGGILTWWYIRSKRPTRMINQLTLLAGLGFILLGLGGVVLAYLQGATSGDFEYYLFVADALFTGQGALTVFTVWWEKNRLVNA